MLLCVRRRLIGYGGVRVKVYGLGEVQAFGLQAGFEVMRGQDPSSDLSHEPGFACEVGGIYYIAIVGLGYWIDHGLVLRKMPMISDRDVIEDGD